MEDIFTLFALSHFGVFVYNFLLFNLFPVDGKSKIQKGINSKEKFSKRWGLILVNHILLMFQLVAM